MIACVVSSGVRMILYIFLIVLMDWTIIVHDRSVTFKNVMTSAFVVNVIRPKTKGGGGEKVLWDPVTRSIGRFQVLEMSPKALDPITSLRTEWVSAALCTNQIPRSADVCLQLGCEDGRIVTFVPRTIREIRTSSLEVDGIMKLSTQRRLKQTQERRQPNAPTVTYIDQRADNLTGTPDSSIDVVVSLQSAQRMHDNGLDWKGSIREAARVLKPGGRFLFVEQIDIDGESYLDYVRDLAMDRPNTDNRTDNNTTPNKDSNTLSSTMDTNTDNQNNQLMFEDLGFDAIDLVLVPHIAGVAIKVTTNEDALLSEEEMKKRQEQEEQERLADLTIQAYERGIKKRKRKKKSTTTEAQKTMNDSTKTKMGMKK